MPAQCTIAGGAHQALFVAEMHRNPLGKAHYLRLKPVGGLPGQQLVPKLVQRFEHGTMFIIELRKEYRVTVGPLQTDFSLGCYGVKSQPRPVRVQILRKTASGRSPDFRERHRCGSPKLGWDPAVDCLVQKRSIPGQVRVLFPFQKRQTSPLPVIPRRENRNSWLAKKPLCCNCQRKNSKHKFLQTPAPASTLSIRLTLFRPPLLQRAG
jgi:hypothetical protein